MSTQVTIKAVGDPEPWQSNCKRQRWAVDPETGCWNWLLYRLATGYGQMRKGGRALLAHRYYWEQVNGPIPPGLQIDHLCRNRACVNPDHLEAVTQLENLRRGRHTKLTEEIVEEILRSSERHGVLALRYGVDQSHIGKIRKRGSWSRGKAAA